jgi:hypothetical protein
MKISFKGLVNRQVKKKTEVTLLNSFDTGSPASIRMIMGSSEERSLDPKSSTIC